MEWTDWSAQMDAIRAQFGYAEATDREAALLLRDRMPAPQPWRMLGVQLRNRRNLAILGCGPNLSRTPVAELAGKVIVAADGATSWLREQGVIPNLIVTDLDGAEADLEWAARQGALMVLHAHGDNQDAIVRLAPRLGPLAWGTHQVEPTADLEPLRNLGGFTDGDRAVLLCEAFGGLRATLYGFDFDAPPSPYSGRFDPATKPAKLQWARRIVEACQVRGKLQLTLWQP
ncbi:MAG: 6-hydroxymethylpterin diphosphokinase MptE-like protein [Candidatus Thermoplasmatota archaeon]